MFLANNTDMIQKFITNDTTHQKIFQDTGGSQLIGRKTRYKIQSVSGQIGNNATNNYTITFKIPSKGAAALDKLRLITKVKFTVSGGTYNRYLKAMPIYQFTQIEILHNNTQVLTLDPDQIYQKIYMHTDKDDWTYVSKHYGLGDNTSRAVTNNLEVYFYLNFAHLWSMFKKQFPIFLLKNDLEIVLHYRNANLTETDGTCSYTYLETYLLATYNTIQNQKILQNFLSNGFKMIEIVPINDKQTVVTTSSTQNYILQFMTDKNVVLMTFVNREDTDVNANKFTVFKQLKEFALTHQGTYLDGNNGVKLTDSEFKEMILFDSDLENKDMLNSDNLYYISYGNSLKNQFTDDINKYSGSRLFRESQPSLDIVYTANPNQGSMLVIAWTMQPVLISNGSLISR